MARREYGGGLTDFTTDKAGLVRAGKDAYFWDARTGGTQLTDIQATAPGATATGGTYISGPTGAIAIAGPDGYDADSIWVSPAPDVSAPRYLLRAVVINGTGTGGGGGGPVDVPDATSAVKGVVQLTGHLGGTATNPTVTRVYTKADVGLGAVDNTADTAKPLSTPQALALATGLAGKADLVGGLIPTAQIPALALTTTIAVADQAAMLALTAAQVQPGDIAVRSDGAGTFVLVATDPSQLSSWLRLNAPTDVVQSVNGQAGTVVLGKSDVGLASVDNVSAAALRDRSTHTGTQPATTITGLAGVATSGAYSDLTGTPAQPDLAPYVTKTAADAAYQQRWQPNTTYAQDAVVISPDGRAVKAKTAFTSGATYDANNWTAVGDAFYLAKPTAAGSSGQVLTVQPDGTNAWAATVARQVIEHGAVASTLRPTTSGPVTWIGSVQPTNWLDGDDWYEATAVVVDIPTANLVNYWRAEDLTLSSGQAVTTMANRVSGGPALTASGGPVFNVESSVSSVLLDGVDDQLSETTTALNQPTTTITVGRFVTAAASKPWVGATNLHAITATSASKWSANGGTSLAHTASIDTGWHMVAAVFNGASTIIYVDGVAVTGAGGANARAGTRIGTNSGQTAFSNMKITTVAQYSTALTAADLDSIRTTLKTRYPVLP